MKIIRLILICAFFTFSGYKAFCQNDQPYYYQLKVFHLKTDDQVGRLDKFLSEAYLPALHRNGIDKAGVFKQVEKDSLEQLVYVFIPFKSFEDFESLESKLQKDGEYLQRGKDFLMASYDEIPYQRIESILLKAFRNMTSPHIPELTSPKSERIYELRSYESPTENYFISKVHMFNERREIDIFSKLNFNAVFYSEVISGSHMPNLMYMTSFNNKQDRDEHWKAFGADPAWVRLKALPEYQNNVSKADIMFLYPTDYSDF